ASDRTAHLDVAELLRHPRIRARFTDWNRTQQFPGTKLKWRTNWRQRNIEPEILSRKIIGQFRTNRIEMPVFTGNDIGPKPLSQDRQLALHRTSINELEQTEPFIVRNRQHRAEWSFNPFGKQTALRLCCGRRFAKNPRESVTKPAF